MISTGTKLEYKDTTYKAIGGVLNIPDMGQGTPEKIDVTTLADGTKKYVAGIKELADVLSFDLLLDPDENFTKVQELADNKIHEWRVVLPNNISFEFSGSCTYTVLSFGVGEAIKFRLDIIPNSEITLGTAVLSALKE